MTKVPTQDGQILFQCRCMTQEAGDDDDTLMDQDQLDTIENLEKYAGFLANAPHDMAKNVVMRECPKCHLDFMTLVRIGESERTVYACSCGYRATHRQHEEWRVSAKK